MIAVDWIAERTLKATTRDNREFEIVLRLGRPYQAPKGEYVCPVDAEGLVSSLAGQRGVDALQAILLAVKLLRSLVQGVIDDGGELRWLDGSPVSVAELFHQN